MKNTIVIYQSKYGSTKQYAEWIAEALNCRSCEATKTSIEELLQYETIIFGGGLYASGINGVSLITKNFEKLRVKKLIVFTVGLASTEDTSIFEPIINKNFKKEMQPSVQFFHLRGGIDYTKLNLIHKTMMAMLKKTVIKKGESNLTDEDQLLLSTYGDQIDFTDQSTIQPILDCAKV